MKDFLVTGQGIYALGLLVLIVGVPAEGAQPADPRLEQAIGHASDESLASVRQALAHEGYHPFLLRSVAAQMSPRERQAQGLIHCGSPREGRRICGRIVARLLDSSPLHFQVVGTEGFPLHSAHLVLRDGRTRRLSVDNDGLIDVPARFQQRWVRLGITVRGPDGPETGLFLAHEAGEAALSPCTETKHSAEMVRAINQLRVDLGATPLQIVKAPTAYAQSRQRALRKRFAHPDEGLGPLLRSLDLRLRRAAELLAEDEEMGAVCEGWMQSPSHRAALLDPRRNRIALVQQGSRVAALLWQNR